MLENNELLGWIYSNKTLIPSYRGKRPDLSTNKEYLYYSCIHKQWGMLNINNKSVKFTPSLQVSKEAKAMLLLLKD